MYVVGRGSRLVTTVPWPRNCIGRFQSGRAHTCPVAPLCLVTTGDTSAIDMISTRKRLPQHRGGVNDPCEDQSGSDRRTRGSDWEAAEYARADIDPYLLQRRAGLSRFDALVERLEPIAGARRKSDKRAFVERVHAILDADDAYPEDWWFSVAMKLFDAGSDDARLIVDAALLGEPLPSLRAWHRDPAAEVRAILSAPVREEDG